MAFLDALWNNPHLRQNVLQIRRISERILVSMPLADNNSIPASTTGIVGNPID
jgi:hypothetical protein